MADRRILLTGGSGRLGTAIRRLIDCSAPTHEEMRIEDLRSCYRWVEMADPDVVIHCAGYVNSAGSERNPELAWRMNVLGTRNILRASAGARVVQISTDYVFDGRRGNYREDDPTGPVNYYGYTKAVAEQMALEHGRVLVLRIPFRADPPWRYPRAFADQWTSCRWASEAAVDAVRAAAMDYHGILHIGGPRRSILEMARSADPEVGSMLRKDVEVALPKDTSLDSSLWHSLSAQ